MNIVQAYPPNIAKIKLVLPLHPGIVFAYGDTLYNPDNGPVDIALMAHEKTHQVQQGADPEAWWDRYIVDMNFRASQEIEAYQNQYKKAKTLIADKNKLARLLDVLASDLASPMYGSCMTKSEAKKAIIHPRPIRFHV